MYKVSAHRGVHTGPYQENTIPAFEEARKIKCDMIEFDVRLTGDGLWIIHHDLSINRKLKISDTRYDEIQSYCEETGYRVDLLEDLLDQFQDINLNIETKEKTEENGERLAKFLQDYDTALVNISSFHTKTLIGINKVDDQLKLSQLGYILPFINWWRVQRKIPLYSINPYVDFVNYHKVTQLHKRDIEVHAWVANSYEQIDNMANAGVDVIITDNPQDVITYRDNTSSITNKING